MCGKCKQKVAAIIALFTIEALEEGVPVSHIPLIILKNIPYP